MPFFPSVRAAVFVFALYCLPFVAVAQGQSPFFIQPEIMGGSIIPNVPNYPDIGMNAGMHVSIGKYQRDPENGWAKFYNHPYTGLQLGYNRLGNDHVFGSQLSALSLIAIPTSRRPGKGVEVQLALGASYFTKRYHETDNPDNLFIGSPVTWAFNLFIYKSWLLNDYLDLRLGGGYMHGSNGHIQLPNFGVNSGMLSLGLRYFPKGRTILERESKPAATGKRPLYLMLRQGFGIHELGGPIRPIGGKNRLIYGSAVSVGGLFKNHILIRGGITYRHYRQYLHYIETNQLEEYLGAPRWSASALSAHFGSEFLIGHVSMDVEAGFNITKPFYKTHFEVFENTHEFDRVSKRLVAMRMGMNLYLINTKKQPTHNLRVGAYINANMGQADYSELSVGYVYRWR